MVAASPRRRIVATIAVAVASSVGITALVVAAPARSGGSVELLPDLMIVGSPHAYLEHAGDHALRLRLDNTVANRGTGPLEIFPGDGPAAECNPTGPPEEGRFAWQRIFLDNPGADSPRYFERADDTESTTEQIGCMRFHPAHDHWHLEGFSKYTLRRLPAGRFVGAATKVGFCLLDGFDESPDLPGAPEAGYYPHEDDEPGFANCSPTSTNGISIGWADSYFAGLQGQSIVVTGIRQGRFCLISTADPEDRIRETNDANNSRGFRLEIHPRKGTVEPLPGSCRRLAT
jgi:Lysyl oxidase